MKPKASPFTDAVLDEAILWTVRLQSGEATPHERHACEQWRALDPEHELAWQALQRNAASFQHLAELPGIAPGITHRALDQLQRPGLGRRQILQCLGAGLVIGVTGWQAPSVYRRWQADYSTARGERRTVWLADGSRLQLNTDTAVRVHFNATQRRIVLLSGEIHVQTGADRDAANGHRRFWVDTPQAELEALGTVFSVRLNEHDTGLFVERDQVRVDSRGERQIVNADDSVTVDAVGIRTPRGNGLDPSAWTEGQLIARRTPLGDVITELARYQRGWLSCDPAVAALPVSGVFQLDALDQALAALTDSQPIRLERFTPWWRRVVAR